MWLALTTWSLSIRDKVFANFNYFVYNNSVTRWGGAIMILKG